MSIEQLTKETVEEVIALWNEEHDNGSFLHKKMDLQIFEEKFMSEQKDLTKINLIYRQNKEVIGFINGCVKSGADTAYLTFVLVKKNYRRQGFGRLLVEELETLLKQNNKLVKFDLIFFNPINLEWIVPNTDGHDHPNAPGVDVFSDAYIFFKNMGYRDVAYQNSYYQPLATFEFSEQIKQRIESLKEKDIYITYYDKNLHHGWDELFDDFKNPLWTETIMENISRPDGGDPVLIVEHEGKICGFTGPLSVQPSKRGYFCGIGVHSDYRKHGAGKVLFSALCKGLKDLGAEYMTLFTGETNPARNIYESANFKIVRTWSDMRKEIK